MSAKLPDSSDIPLVSAQPVELRGAGAGAEGAAQAFSEIGQTDLQTGDQLARGLSQVAQGAGQAIDAQNAQSAAYGQAQFLSAKLALDAKYANDPDPSTVPQRYAADLQNAAQAAGSNIVGAPAQAQFQMGLQRIKSYAVDSIQRQARSQSISADRGWLDAFLNDPSSGIVSQYAASPDPTAGATFLQSGQQAIQAVQAKGSISPDEASTLSRGLATSAATARLTLMAKNNPVATLAMINSSLKPGATPTAPQSNDPLAGPIAAASSQTGVSPDYLSRVAQLESNGDTGAINPTTGAAGAFQFTPPVAAHYGIDPNDPGQAAAGAARLAVDNRAALIKSLGRAPSDAELYLSHLQGAGGAAALLTNPTANAVSALTPIYGNAATAQQAIVNNGGTADMTAGQYTDLINAKYAAAAPTGPIPTTPAAHPDSPYAETKTWLDLVPINKRIEIGNAASADTNRLIALNQKQITDASNQAESQVIADATGVGTNPNVSAAQIADPNGPYKALLPDAKLRMIDFISRTAAATAGNNDTKTYGPLFTSNLARVYLPDGDPNKLNDPSSLVTQIGNGLTVDGFTRLKSEIDARGTPDGVAESTMKQAFLADAKSQISGENELLRMRDPKGADLYLKFLAQALPAYDAGRKAGKSPAQLLGPDSPDYIGKSISRFVRPPSVFTQDLLNENSPDSQTAAPDLTTRDGIVNAYKGGSISYADAEAALAKGGFIAPTPSGPQVPIAQ